MVGKPILDAKLNIKLVENSNKAVSKFFKKLYKMLLQRKSFQNLLEKNMSDMIPLFLMQYMALLICKF